MPQDLERLIVSLEANLKQYERELARAQKVTVTQLRAMERQAQVSATRMERALTRLGPALKASFAALGVGSVTLALSKLQRAISDVADIGDLADKIGITAEALQELNFGAVQANMSLDELGSALLFFSRQIGEASRGEGELLEILEANNIALRDSQGNLRPINELLRDYANVVSNAANQQEGLVFVTKAFGRASDEMLEFLGKGAGGLDTYATAARNAGSVIDEELVKRAQKFDDAWATATLTASQNFKSFVLRALESSAPLLQRLRDLSDSFISGDAGLASINKRISESGLNANTRVSPTGGAFRSNPFAPTQPTSVLPPAETFETTARAAKELGPPLSIINDELERISDVEREVSSALSGFLGDLARGVSAADAFSSAIDGLTQAFIDMWSDVLARQAMGFLSSLFKGGGGAGTGFAQSRGFMGGLFHQGGIVGYGGARRAVSPLAFAGAPRMHSGGIAGNEVPAILQKGEMVLPRGARPGGGNVSVVINNHTGAPVQQRETRSGDERQVEIIIGRMIGDGRLDGAMRGRFGASPSPRSR